ncbi:D-alanyl-D-alanine carboxypeptidase [Caulobacter segnis]|uniref:D-alanyl-D-alanine carboxypeptidase n=1 Tax=Caulobacter segnis TaxID=88688 RepID=UPI002410A5CA|nr:D-alanyl-D-alanine carboxypeptidase [Caulobacter segnis]MDG2522262.1 D-alanyl-D-alanine carboxypeptidase [Caulobacter segnis]
MTQHARRLLTAFGLAAGLIVSATAATAAPILKVPTSEPRYAAIVMDANSGEILYSKRGDSPRYPASITKVMTMYMAFEALAEGKLRLTDEIVVSPRAAAQQPTKLGLRAGSRITVDEVLRAMALKSANDMAVAMAERLGGTETRFSAMMTLRAQELGMENTRFVNASGLPDSRQISTAHDLAILSRAVMRDYPQYYAYFGQQNAVVRGQAMRNHNKLLGKMPGVDGLKTGFTNASGYNLAASAVQNNRRLIAVVLGGPSGASRDNSVEDLLLTGFDVIKRRSRGERITVAQNLFEPEPSGPIMRPSIEQGDAEQDNLKIVLTENPATPPKMTVQKKMPAKSAGAYKVQVGAFKQKSLAGKQLQITEKKFAKVFANATGSVESGPGGSFRARFSGFSADGAQRACATLTAQRQVCMIVKP